MLEKIKIKKSIDLYRSNISLENHFVDDYINLILLLWNISFDYGLESYCVNNNIFLEKDIMNFSFEIENLFNDAFKEYPDNKHLLFWSIYINDLSAYSECSHKKKIYILLNEDNFLLPHFYLYIQCNISNTKELIKLKDSLIKEKDSYKKYYMLSYLDDIPLSEVKKINR